jgi:hypothetical protein
MKSGLTRTEETCSGQLPLCGLDEEIRELIGRRVLEIARVCIFDFIQLRHDGLLHTLVAVTDARHGGARRRIEDLLAILQCQVQPGRRHHGRVLGRVGALVEQGRFAGGDGTHGEKKSLMVG